jgi:hypothetical protein
VADENQFFERVQEILKSIDQEELNGVFQVWTRRVQAVSQVRAMETTPNDK